MSRFLSARLAGVLGLAFAGASHSAVFINEIHYDDSTAAGDVGEAVEVVATAGEDLSLYSVIPYNGSGGASYTPTGSPGPGSIVSCGGSVRIGIAAIAGLQNGAPDGVALVLNGTTVVQFLSYEGTFTATNGPANGITSTGIPVSETNSTAPGTSLQLNGSNGAAYGDFTWTASATATFGACNTTQTFGAAPDVAPTVTGTTPADLATNVAANANITIAFSETVATTGEWFSIDCPTSGTRMVGATAVSGAGASRTIDPNVDFAFDETCTVTIEAPNVVDTDGTPNELAGNYRFAFTIASAPVDVPPTVESVVPASGASNVATSASLTVKFSEAVTAPASAFALTCANSGMHAFTLSGGPSTYGLDPTVDFAELESCSIAIDAEQVFDQDGTVQAMVADFLSSFTTRAGSGTYYNGVDASSCVALRSTLHTLIDDHTAVPYTATGQTDTWDILEAADQNPLVPTEILEVYENAHYPKAGGGNSNYNREHTWPNSYGFNNLSGTSGVAPNLVPQSSAYVDTHMLYLSDIEYNSNRGSKPYANCSAACAADVTLAYNGFGGGAVTYPGNHNWVQSPDGSAGTYEVWNHRKGDMSRAVLYMDIRYEGGQATGGNTVGQFEPDLVVTDNRTLIANGASSGSTSSSVTAYMGLKTDLIAWHNADPPDTQEQLRNDVVFSFQGNRNPFIDHPEWVAIAFASPCTGSVPNQPPVLGNASHAVLENAVNGTLVATLAATDPEAGTITYAITAGNGSGAFALNPTSGALTVAQSALIDGAVQSSYVLTISATDNGAPPAATSATITVSVTSVNDAPSFTKGADVVVNEDAGPQSAAWASAISAGPSNESTQTVAFNVTGNTNTALFSAGPAVASSGVLSFTPAANANGTATITLAAQDNGGTANGGVDTSAAQTFVITVSAVNDAPGFTKGADVVVNEDAGPQSTVWASAISAGPSNESTQTVAFNVTGNTSAALFSAGPAIAPNGVLSFTPAANANGTATITLAAQDNGGTANGGVDTAAAQTFVITVNAINDAPSFTKGADVAINEDAAPQSVAWATAINAGPPNESTQTLAFNVIGNTNTALFSVAPAIAANGTLTYASAANASGTATITLVAQDNGGVANGGVDTSTAQEFVVTVAPVDDPAVAVDDAPAAIGEDSGTATFAVLGNDTDIDGGTLLVTGVGASSGGTAAVGAGGANVTFTPALNFCGATSFGYTITGGATGTVSVTVTCVNDAPIAPDANASIAAGASAGTSVATVAASDVDSATLAYTITSGNTGGAFAIDAATGAITVATPAALHTGNSPFVLVVTVSDGGTPVQSDTAAITITVTPTSEAIFSNGFE
jgi:methionine-rich copper-binding protein CopC